MYAWRRTEEALYGNESEPNYFLRSVGINAIGVRKVISLTILGIHRRSRG